MHTFFAGNPEHMVGGGLSAMDESCMQLAKQRLLPKQASGSEPAQAPAKVGGHTRTQHAQRRTWPAGATCFAFSKRPLKCFLRWSLGSKFIGGAVAKCCNVDSRQSGGAMCGRVVEACFSLAWVGPSGAMSKGWVSTLSTGEPGSRRYHVGPLSPHKKTRTACELKMFLATRKLLGAQVGPNSVLESLQPITVLACHCMHVSQTTQCQELHVHEPQIPLAFLDVFAFFACLITQLAWAAIACNPDRNCNKCHACS